MRTQPVRISAALAAVVLMGACSDMGDVTGVPNLAPSFVTLPANPIEGVIHVCKDFATADNFSFNLTVNGGVNHTVHVSNPFSLAGGSCVLVASVPAVGTNFVDVTVSETVPQDVTLAKIEVYTFAANNPGAGWNGAPVQTFTNTTSVTTRAGNDLGRVIVFYNEADPPPPGFEGCTPGYWKNHQSSWTGYTTGQLNGSVFNLAAYPTLAGHTLLQSLSYGGGSTIQQAIQILLRAAVAALLNAAHPDVDYTMSAADIVAAVNAAIASGNRETILSLATSIDTDNNLGCPIN